MTGPMPEVGVNFRVHGLDPVARSLRLVKDQADPTARQWGMASRQIAGGLEQIARTGRVTGESLKQVISQGAEMAFMFGAGGPIVAALGVVGVAIYEGITNNLKAAREEVRAFQTELQGVRRAGDVTGAGSLAQRLYSGDRFAVQREGESDREFQARQGGVLGIRAKIAGLPKGPGGMFSAGSREADEQREWNKLLAQYEDRAKRAALAVSELATTEARRILALAGNREGLPTINGGGGVPIPGLGGPSMMGTTPAGVASAFMPLRAVGIGKASPRDNPATMAMVENMRAVGEMAGRGFVDTLASTIEAGMTRAFQRGANIGSIFASMGEAALSGLGGVLMAIGKQALAGLTLIATVRDAIMNWTTTHPAAGLAAAVAMIAIGAALGGAGHRMGANASGMGGGGYGAYGSGSGYGSTIIDRGIIDPTRGAGVSAQRPVVMQAVFFGHRDPVAQREFQEWAAAALRRGTA